MLFFSTYLVGKPVVAPLVAGNQSVVFLDHGTRSAESLVAVAVVAGWEPGQMSGKAGHHDWAV